jgi:hypothetical protein
LIFLEEILDIDGVLDRNIGFLWASLIGKDWLLWVIEGFQRRRGGFVYRGEEGLGIFLLIWDCFPFDQRKGFLEGEGGGEEGGDFFWSSYF